MLRGAIATLFAITLVAGSAVAAPPPGDEKADPKAGEKSSEPAAAAPKGAADAQKSPTPAPKQVIPGKLPALNTVVEPPAARTRREPGKPDDLQGTAPPLNIGALRDELRRGAGEDDRPGSKKRMEQMAVDINKAREALRADTERLEALLARSEGGGGGGAAPEGGKKIPTSLDTLAKAMRGMKPEQAAPIVTRLDKKLAADVLQRMPAADAGKVMGQLKPEVAAELAAEIASRTPRAELRR